MFRCVKDWWTGVRAVRALRRTQKKMLDMASFAAVTLALWKDREKALTRLGKSLEEQRTEVEVAAVVSRKLVTKMEEALDAARAELRVAEKTMETLVAANKLLNDRLDADSAIQTRLRLAQTRTEE